MKKNRSFSAAVIVLVLLLALAAVMLWRSDNPSMFPRDDMYFRKNPTIDRIRMYAFDYDGNILLGEVTDTELIQRYISSHRWEDPYRICCDEITAYVFEEFAGENKVGSSKLPRGRAKYNNRAFAAVQRELLAHVNALPADEATDEENK